MLLNIGCGVVAQSDCLNLRMEIRYPLAVTCEMRRGWLLGPLYGRISTLASFALDLTGANATQSKPDSLYVEAMRAEE